MAALRGNTGHPRPRHAGVCPSCAGHGRAHPCARAMGCSVARKVEDQKMKISFCCLGSLSFSVNKNGKAIAKHH